MSALDDYERPTQEPRLLEEDPLAEDDPKWNRVRNFCRVGGEEMGR